MKKYLKFIIPVLVCIVIVGVTFYMIFDIKDKVEDTYYNTDDIMDDEEVINESEENLVEEENNNVENSSENETTTNQTTQSPNDSPIVDENDDDGTTDKKQQAIDLVKAEWGEDDTVSFRCDSVTSSGEYIVAVISKSSATVKNYFKVNLADKTVEIYY